MVLSGPTILASSQLWLVRNLSTFDELSQCLKKQYWQLLPLGGIIRSAKKEIRQTSLGFYGAGCPHPGVECDIAQVNKLLMHFGCPSTLGLTNKVSLNFLRVELGISVQPLQESYQKFGSWATNCWLKSLWEKCDHLDIRVEFNDDTLKLPRGRDTWLMLEFIRIGYSDKELIRLNRVRVCQQVLFLSEILGASGKELDLRYLRRRPLDERWSTLDFPQEKPPRKDFQLWEQALRQLVPAEGIQDRLGPFLHDGYKIWPWRHNAASNTLWHVNSTGATSYKPSQQARYANLPNRWEADSTINEAYASGHICSVKKHSATIVSIASTAEPMEAIEPPECIFDVLLDWGHT